MKISRVSVATLTLAALSLLAACGGGGGGGGVTPPGGGGGGGSTPTPIPTGTSTPTPTPTSTPSGTTISAEINFINGDMSWYTSGTCTWSNHCGDTSSAPHGGSTDGMSCANTPEGGSSFPAGQLTEHAFVGIFFNGTEEALPQALGMVKPVEPSVSHGGGPDTYEVETNQCEYNIHTHDYSGLVHVEDVTQPQSSTFPSYATLKSLMDVAGFSLSSTGLTAGSSSLTGAVTVYAGTPSHKDSGGNDIVDSFTPTTTSVQLSKHMAVWIVIGTPPTSGLPQVKFVIVN